MYCGNNKNNRSLLNGTKVLGTRHSCLKNGVGFGIEKCKRNTGRRGAHLQSLLGHGRRGQHQPDNSGLDETFQRHWDPRLMFEWRSLRRGIKLVQAFASLA